MFQFMRVCMLFIGMLLLGLGQAHASEGAVLHTIRSGDFLVRIAEEFPGVSWRAIAKANKLHSPYVIYTGKTLIIPMPTKSGRATVSQQSTANAVKLKTAERAVASEVIQSDDGPAHVFQGKVPNRITPEVAIELLFNDVAPLERGRILANVASGTYSPILLPVGYRVGMMLTADGIRHENVLIAPMTDVPLLGMCYALPTEEYGTLLLIHEIKSWNWYREIIPNGETADCLRKRTGLRESDIAPPSVVRGDEALMPYAAIPRSQAR